MPTVREYSHRNKANLDLASSSRARSRRLFLGTSSGSRLTRHRITPELGKSDVAAAVTSAVASVPNGMASGVLAGVKSVYGLYILIVGMPSCAQLASTEIMVFNTTSAMTQVTWIKLVPTTICRGRGHRRLNSTGEATEDKTGSAPK